MSLLILSCELDILHVSPEGTVPFVPQECSIGQPVQSATALIAVDPGLPQACRDLLQGCAVAPCAIEHGDEAGFLRRLSLRKGSGDRQDEIIVIYEPRPGRSQAAVRHLRRQIVQELESHSDAIAYFDKDDRLVMCNDAYANMHPGPEGPLKVGMTFEEILRRDLRHGALPISAQRQDAWVAQRRAERRKPYLIRDIRMRDGRLYRLLEQRLPDDGRMMLLIDITEFQEVEERLLDALTGAAFGTWSFDLESEVTDLDARAAAMLGYATREISPMSPEGWRAILHPEDLPRIEALIASNLAGETVNFQCEYRMRHREGHWVWLQAQGGVTHCHPDGRPRIVSGIQIDITHQKTLEADLVLRAAAITAASDGIAITDGAGVILDANPAFVRMLGHRDAGQLVGRSWTEGISLDPLAPTEALVGSALGRDGRWLGPGVAKSADGTMLELDLSLTQMPDGRIVVISRDVSARNALDRDRLELRERLNRAHHLQIVNLLAAGLTHDLVNLTALISHLSDPAGRGFAGDPQMVLAEIHAAARQMVMLLEPIRDLGRRQPQRAVTDLGAIVTEAVGILHLGAPSHVKLRTHLPGAPIKAEVDPMQVMQVLLNLGLNARDALGEGPQTIDLSLTLTTALPPDATLETGVIPEAPFALFAVQDSGSGIPPDVRAQIWQPFFTTKSLRGTGLGLYVVADIVRSAGGGIALRTAPGQGTSFFIAWPLTRPRPENVPPAQDTSAL